MKTALLLLATTFTFSFTKAAEQIPELSCLNAGGFYGNFALRRDGLQIEAVAQQGYAYELSTALGSPAGQEAARIDLRFVQYQCVLGLKGSLRCQGSVMAIVERFTEPRVTMTSLDADVAIHPSTPGYEITVSVSDPVTNRHGSATVKFESCRLH